MRIVEIDKNKYKVIHEIGKDLTGKRKRVSKIFTAKSKRELNRMINDWVSTLDINKGESNQTVSSMCDSVWSRIIANKSPNTIRGYNISLDRIKSSIGDLKASEVNPRVLQQWVNSLQRKKTARTNKPLSPKSIKETYSVLRLCYSVAVTWEIVSSNPCHDVILPQREKHDIKIMTQEEFKIFISNLDSLDLDTKVLIELALFCGMRRGEIMGIHEDEITETGILHLNHARYNNHNDTYEKEVKTAAGFRKVIIPQFLLEDIKKLKEFHESESIRLKGIWIYSPYLIKMADGRAFSPNEAHRRLNKYMKDNGLEPISFHALRHTYASMIIASGADIATVSSRLGHSNINTTLGIYTHLFEDNSQTDPIAAYIDNMVKK